MNADRLEELRRVTTIESAGSSTRIEGADLSDAQVAQVLQGLSIDSFRPRDEAEVKGYANFLAMIYEDFDAITLTENHIKAHPRFTNRSTSLPLVFTKAFDGCSESITISPN